MIVDVNLRYMNLNAMKSGVQPTNGKGRTEEVASVFECDEERSATLQAARGAASALSFECDEERSAT